MFVYDNHFDGWKEKLHGAVKKMGKDEKLPDNQDLCLMLHISPRTLQRYRSEGSLPFLKYGQKSITKPLMSGILSTLIANRSGGCGQAKTTKDTNICYCANYARLLLIAY
ncbi:MAG: helix-turn-helix domain-containing protein [Tannerella sp.]|jgi:hypothetical protein|nr:helix-turn-helix domain-containing protein [Tannerella sp.]